MILGIDIGGSFIDVVSMKNKKFFFISSFPTSYKNIEKLHRIVNINKYEKVCVGIAGWIRNGKILNAPNLPFKLSFNFKNYILENDANCFAFGVSRIFNKKNLLGITVGTGIGMGIILDGKIYRGKGIAGEIGHVIVGGRGKCVCGGKGHLECYFSGWSIKKRYKKDAKELFKKDEFPYDRNFEIFCKAIANVILIFDIPFIAIGGRIGGRLKEEKIKKIYEYLPKQFKPEIRVIKDDLMVAKGACLLAKENHRRRNIIK